MEKKRIHPDGPEFSRLITGVWRWKEQSTSATERLIHQSVDAGITTFDHADIYGDYSCEEQFGAVLKENSSLRKKIQLVTKCGIRLLSEKRPQHRVKYYDTSREHIISSVEQSLKNLSTDYLDLLLLHRPDPLLHAEEVAEAFGLLRQSGKVLHFGVSNFTPMQFEMLQSYVHDPLVTNQVEFSLFQHQALFDGTVDTLMKHRISPMAWSPLGGGKYFSSSGGDDAVNIPLEKMSTTYNCSVSQLLLGWLLRHPSGIFPILGTTNPDRIAEGAGAINISLDRQDWFEMLKVVTGRDVA